MTKEELFRAVGEVQEDQITEAETVKKQSRPWRRYGTLAACLAVVLAGAFALERMEGARKWAELEEGFDTLARPESALDSGGGAEDEVGWHEKIVEFHPAEVPEDNAGLDGADYWSGRDTRPASNYSVNVEIGELDGGARTEDDIIIDGEKHRTETDSASCLAWLSPEEIFAQDTAVFRGIILQNLLQNAVEACEKVKEGERFIVLAGKRTGRFFLIEVKNSFAGEVVLGQNGLPVSTKKEDVSMHGIGLSNVRREAEKYMGELELKTERQVFSAAVLLQERSGL